MVLYFRDQLQTVVKLTCVHLVQLLTSVDSSGEAYNHLVLFQVGESVSKAH
jgi:hypothetical protein